MPITDTHPSAGVLVAFGVGDIGFGNSVDAGDPSGPLRYLMLYQAQPGPIGLASETGRDVDADLLMGSASTSNANRADVALYFGNLAAADQILAAMQRLRDSIAAAEDAAPPAAPETREELP